jgi:hypothetical protein
MKCETAVHTSAATASRAGASARQRPARPRIDISDTYLCITATVAPTPPENVRLRRCRRPADRPKVTTLNTLQHEALK